MKPLVTEKAVMKIESQNVITFNVNKNMSKDKIKEEIEKIFNVKVEKVRTLVRSNRKYAYVKLKKEFPAIDIATKLGMM
ncbi:MAG: 50S ribosomal protein L23 [Nanoarchaeota archaeon]